MALGCADIRVLLSSVEQAQRLSPALLPVHGSAHGGIYMLAMGLAPTPSDNIFRADSVRALGRTHRRLHRHTHRTRHRRHLPRPPCRRQRRHATRPCRDETPRRSASSSWHCRCSRASSPHGRCAASVCVTRCCSWCRGLFVPVIALQMALDGVHQPAVMNTKSLAGLRRDNKPEVPRRTRLLVHQFADDALLRRQLLP